MVQNRLQKGAEVKNSKSVKTINPPSFLVHFSYPRGSKIQQISLKSGVENELKIKCDFEVDFCRIFEDFGGILGPKIDPKWKKNGIEKHNDFKTKLAARTPGVDPRSLPRQLPLAAPHMRALSSQSIGVRTKREERRRAKKEERTKREEEGRKEESKKGSIQDLTRLGPEAWAPMLYYF